MSDTVLYDYWRSSASYRVRIALNLGNTSYRSLSVDLVSGQHRLPDYLARNPQGFVPVLDIDGQRLTQSLAILEYLDETRDLGLLPQNAMARAKVRALAQLLAVDVHPVCNLSVVRYAIDQMADESLRDRWMERFIGVGLTAFEATLRDFDIAPFCTGTTPSLVDICLIPQLYNARRWRVDYSQLARICAVEEACKSHPAFIAGHPDQARPSAGSG
jgi:maleylacetoacetate isomerase